MRELPRDDLDEGQRLYDATDGDWTPYQSRLKSQAKAWLFANAPALLAAARRDQGRQQLAETRVPIMLLVAALEFYASADTWNPKQVGYEIASRAEMDRGSRARSALAGAGEAGV
jgi:hypothetical protein